MISFREYNGKKIVAFLRKGDYSHAGEEEAIDLVMNRFSKNKEQQILDVGCGLGGTAHYIQKNGWGNTSAFDIEKVSIDYAKDTYPEVDFYVSDAAKIDELFQDKFDILCLFNSFYAFHDQKSSLLALNKTAKVGAKIAIFDYMNLCESNEVNPFFRGNDSSHPIIPIDLNSIGKLLENTGWQLEEAVNVTDKYLLWYHQLIAKIHEFKNEILEKFGENSYENSCTTYNRILNMITNKLIGGVIIYARKKSCNNQYYLDV